MKATASTVVLLAALLATLPARAQTLAEALEQAWARHPLAASLPARETEAQARAEVAAGMTPGPASFSLSNLNDRLNRNRGREEWEAEVAVPLWLPGQQAARQAEADHARAALEARSAALRLQVAGELRDTWWAIANARSTRDLAARRAASARELESDVLRRFKVGELARFDANLARNESIAAEAELLQAEAALLLAHQAYRDLTGVPAPPLLAGETIVARTAPGAEHPQVSASAAAAQLAQARLKVAGASRRGAPELAVRVMRERAEFGESHANTMGVKLTIPFSSGPRVREDSAAARAELAQAEAELALARQKVQLDAERARLDLDAAERQFAMAQTRREFAADNLRLAEKSFSLGESDLTTLLRARTGAFEAEAFFDRMQVARAAAGSRLKQTLGVLP